MSKTIGALADKLLARFAPGITAGAVVCRDEPVSCARCAAQKAQKRTRRCCDPGGCGAYRWIGTCGNC